MFDAITVAQTPSPLRDTTEIRAAEARWGFRFPTGYDEYMLRFGEGVLGGFLVRIFPPHRLNEPGQDVAAWRNRIREYWFWDDGAHVLTQQRALECVIIGDTWNGDEPIVHPDEPDRIYVLPRHYETIFVAGDGLAAALEWLCGSGQIVEAFDDRIFEPRSTRED